MGDVVGLSRDLRVKVFLDGADVGEMRSAYRSGFVQGFTTNPTLMRKAGIEEYERFAREALEAIPDLPISFEVFSDEFGRMEQEARELASWGEQVYVKVPITNTKGESSIPLIEKLSGDGLRLNVTAILTLESVRAATEALDPDVPSLVSVFAGRIADTGVDPVPIMAKSVSILAERPKSELIWASPREVLNVVQAEQCGCHIITMTRPILDKLPILDRDLDDLSLDTVKMFHDDAIAAGYRIL